MDKKIQYKGYRWSYDGNLFITQQCEGAAKCCAIGAANCGKKECVADLLEEIVKPGSCPPNVEWGEPGYRPAICDMFRCDVDAHCDGKTGFSSINYNVTMLHSCLNYTAYNCDCNKRKLYSAKMLCPFVFLLQTSYRKTFDDFAMVLSDIVGVSLLGLQFLLSLWLNLP